MVCRNMCTSEGLVVDPGDKVSKEVRISPDRLFWPESTHEGLIAVDPSTSLLFERQVQVYQTRSLKYDSDMLFAFEGLLSIQELIAIMGVPILKIPPEGSGSASMTRYGFAHSLAWRNEKSGNLHHRSRCDQSRCRSFGCRDNYLTEFPSWSWISRTAVRTSFQCFSRNHAKPYGRDIYDAPPETRLNIPYCADIYVHVDATMHRIANSLAPFISSCQDTAITGDVRNLQIKSQVAHWSRFYNFHGHAGKVDLRIKPATASKGQLPYWLDFDERSLSIGRGYLGDIHFDNPNRETWPTLGLAILLYATCLKVVRSCSTETEVSIIGRGQAATMWLAIRDVGDGKFRREGLIECGGSLRPSTVSKAARGELKAPHNLNTIVLG